MAKDMKYNTKMKYVGIFNFKDFYQFCYTWLKEEVGMKIVEEKYEEKIKGLEKEVVVEWKCTSKVADYFEYEMGIKFEIKRLTEVEVNKGNSKIKTNEGEITLSVKGIFVKDPKGQFETTSTNKFLRGIYEKFIIPSRIKEYEDKLIEYCDDFLSQSKAFLDLEGRK